MGNYIVIQRSAKTWTVNYLYDGAAHTKPIPSLATARTIAWWLNTPADLEQFVYKDELGINELLGEYMLT